MDIIINKLRNKLNSFSQHNRGQTIKKISWIPGYNPPNQFASTRIRVYYPHTSINKFCADKYNSIIGYNSKADILILQKTINSSNIRKIKRFKLHNSSIGIKIFIERSTASLSFFFDKDIVTSVIGGPVFTHHVGNLELTISCVQIHLNCVGKFSPADRMK